MLWLLLPPLLLLVVVLLLCVQAEGVELRRSFVALRLFVKIKEKSAKTFRTKPSFKLEFGDATATRATTPYCGSLPIGGFPWRERSAMSVRPTGSTAGRPGRGRKRRRGC